MGTDTLIGGPSDRSIVPEWFQLEGGRALGDVTDSTEMFIIRCQERKQLDREFWDIDYEGPWPHPITHGLVPGDGRPLEIKHITSADADRYLACGYHYYYNGLPHRIRGEHERPGLTETRQAEEATSHYGGEDKIIHLAAMRPNNGADSLPKMLGVISFIIKEPDHHQRSELIIASIYIREEYRRQGLGRKLMDAAAREGELQGCRTASVGDGLAECQETLCASSHEVRLRNQVMAPELPNPRRQAVIQDRAAGASVLMQLSRSPDSPSVMRCELPHVYMAKEETKR